MHDTSSSRSLHAAVVAPPEASASSVFALVDVLSSVGRDWELLHGLPIREPAPFRPLVLSADGEPFADPNGCIVHPHGRLADHPKPDLLIIPDLHLDPVAPPPAHYAAISPWVLNAHASGAIVASICSGAMLLAATGLLDGEDATTHWGFCHSLARQFPRVRVRGERILVPAGAGHRVITSGGASSWHDLMIYLIGRLVGREEARRIARVFLLQGHDEGQLLFASLTAGRQHTDRAVAEAQAWAAINYADANPVAAMAARSGLTPRGFLRRFKQSTGQSPLEYVQTVRIEEAKQLLETTELSVDEIATEIGYEEPASFRRLFRRLVGVTASAYRRRHLKPVA